MTPLEALEAALAVAPRDDDGNVNADLLAKMIADVLEDPDVDAIKLNEARRVIRSRQAPNSTEPDGVLQLFDVYPYEPLRLVADDDGNVIEQDLAKPRSKNAEARRAMLNAEYVLKHARRKQEEASRFMDWQLEETAAGELWSSITFGRFVRDLNLWSAGDLSDDDAAI